MNYTLSKALPLITSIFGAALVTLVTPIASKATTVSLEYNRGILSQWSPDDIANAGVCGVEVANNAFCSLGNNITQASIPSETADDLKYDVLIQNNTPYNLTGIEYTALPGSQLNFDANSKSNIFSNVSSPDPNHLSFSGGVIAPGEYFTDKRTFTNVNTKQNTNLSVNLIYTPISQSSKSVPEPNAPISILAISATMGVVLKKKNAVQLG